MKKAVVVFIVSALVLISTGVWFFSSKSDIAPFEAATGFGVIVLLVVFALFFEIGRAHV